MSIGWNARWLKSTINRHFSGEPIIVVSNREPCVHDLHDDGTVSVRHPISGLVTALDPVVRAVGGTWIAHGSGSGDRAVVDERDRVEVRDDDGGYTLRRVWLSRGEERGYYHGFANSALWPLCHLSFEPPRFTRSDWRHYQDVNRRFADAVVAEATSTRPVVFVQDYHFALLPLYLRQRLPDAVVVAFWHIPWPTAGRFARLPFKEAILEGLLSTDIVGFQTAEHVRNFLDCVEALPDAAVDRCAGLVGRPHGTVAVREYPISIEWPSRWAESAPPVDACRTAVRAELGIADDARVMVSVDRVDYTKGIEERLAAIQRLLARGNATAGRPVFVQVASPSRTRLDSYRRLAERMRSQINGINTRFGDAGYQPIVLLDRHVEPSELVRLYRAADACHVNSLDDGMNLVAKEFVASRDDEGGALVLSRFTGAALELLGALLVNPFDIDAVADTIANALTLAPDEQLRRMRAMRAQVAEHNVFRWAGRLVADAAGVRDVEWNARIPS